MRAGQSFRGLKLPRNSAEPFRARHIAAAAPPGPGEEKARICTLLAVIPVASNPRQSRIALTPPREPPSWRDGSRKRRTLAERESLQKGGGGSHTKSLARPRARGEGSNLRISKTQN